MKARLCSRLGYRQYIPIYREEQVSFTHVLGLFCSRLGYRQCIPIFHIHNIYNIIYVCIYIYILTIFFKKGVQTLYFYILHTPRRPHFGVTALSLHVFPPNRGNNRLVFEAEVRGKVALRRPFSLPPQELGPGPRVRREAPRTRYLHICNIS